jgi:hypothetical protein
MTMDTKITHTFQVTVSSDRLEDFAENLAHLGVKVDADELMRARMEGEVDLIVVGDAMAEVSNFPRSCNKLPGVYVKDFYYREEKRGQGTEHEDYAYLQDPEDPDYEQEPGGIRVLCVSPVPAHMFYFYSWEGPFAGGRPFFHLVLKIKFVGQAEDHCRTKLTWDESYRWFVIKLP